MSKGKVNQELKDYASYRFDIEVINVLGGNDE